MIHIDPKLPNTSSKDDASCHGLSEIPMAQIQQWSPVDRNLLQVFEEAVQIAAQCVRKYIVVNCQNRYVVVDDIRVPLMRDGVFVYDLSIAQLYITLKSDDSHQRFRNTIKRNVRWLDECSKNVTLCQDFPYTWKVENNLIWFIDK
jgi:hypothetical protein